MRLLPALPKIWNYLKYRCLPRKPVVALQQYTPQITSLMVTRRCNLNCQDCPVARMLQPKKGRWRESEATLEKIQRLFANPLLANCLLVDLEGGEPLLVEDLERIVAYLVKRGHLVNLSTNGLLLAERIADLKQAGISRINVSLYDTNRLVLERDLEKINKIFPVDASIVLRRRQVEKEPDKLLEAARFLHDAGCRSLRFWIYRPTGTNPKPEEIIGETLPAYIKFRRRMEKVLPGFCLWPAAIQTGRMKKLCPQLWQRLNGNMLGEIIPCCGSGTTLRGPNSNLFENKPDVVYNHPTLVAMRRQLLDHEEEPPDICKTCNLLGDPGW